MIVLHEKAARRANELASTVVEALFRVERTVGNMLGAGASTRAPDLTLPDFSGTLVGEDLDRFKRTVGLSAIDGRGALKLEGAGFANFRRMLEIFYGNREVAAVVSEKTLSGVAFEWAYETKWGRVTSPMTEFVLDRLDSMVRDVTVVVPIYGLEVEHALNIGRVEFFNLGAEDLQRWKDQADAQRPAEVTDADESASLLVTLRKRYQGRAAARYTTRAEMDHAINCAMRETENSLAALRLFSPGALMPERPTSITLSGREHVPKAEWILHSASDTPTWTLHYGESIMFSEDVHPFVLDAETIRDVLPQFVSHWSDLLSRGARSEFQSAALRSLMLYSRATECRDTTEKLIHIFAAIESLLLRDDREPIGTALADRLALVVGSNLRDRLEIVRNVRRVYTMRSQFVHHGLLASQEDANMVLIEDFLRTVSKLFVALASPLVKHSTRSAFLDELDHRKYQ